MLNTKTNRRAKMKGSCGEAADLTGVYAYIGRNSGWQTFGIVCTEGQAVKPGREATLVIFTLHL
jgi:hypothetical protein